MEIVAPKKPLELRAIEIMLDSIRRAFVEVPTIRCFACREQVPLNTAWKCNGLAFCCEDCIPSHWRESFVVLRPGV